MSLPSGDAGCGCITVQAWDVWERVRHFTVLHIDAVLGISQRDADVPDRRKERSQRGGGAGGGNAFDPTAPREAASEDDDEDAPAAGRAAAAGQSTKLGDIDAEDHLEDDLEPPPGFSPRGAR